MKITHAKGDAFAARPPDDVWGVLLFGPDRGVTRERADALLTAWRVDPADPFALTRPREEDLRADPAKLLDELDAMSLTGGPRAVRLSLSADGFGPVIRRAIAALDDRTGPPAARLIVEAGELTPKSKMRAAFEGGKRVAAVPSYVDDARTLGELAMASLTESGVALTPDAKDALPSALPEDRGLARQEIEKLALYAHGSDAHVSLDDLDAVLARDDDASLDDIVLSAMSGNRSAMDAALTIAFDAGGSGVSVVRALQRHIAALLDARGKVEAGANAASAVGQVRPPFFGPRKAAAIAHVEAWTSARLAHALTLTLDAERALKTRAPSERALVGALCSRLAGAVRPQR